MIDQKSKGFNCTYKNPKREAYHEAGHIVALFLLTGDIEGIKRNGPGQRFNTLEQYQQTFNEVCFWVAGGVAERVYCMLRGLPKNTMADDIDILLSRAKHDWQFPFKQMKTGFPGCPILDNMIKSAEDFLTALFRSDNTIPKIRAVADYLIEKSLLSPNTLNALGNKPKRELLIILKTKFITYNHN